MSGHDARAPLQPLQRSVASIATAMFSSMPLGGAHVSSEQYKNCYAPPHARNEFQNNVKLEEVDADEDLFASQTSNCDPAPSFPMVRDTNEDLEAMSSQASEMMSFSQVAQSYDEGDEQRVPAAETNDRMTQDSDGTSFTQILDDINRKTAGMNKKIPQNRDNNFESLFSSASSASSNLTQGSQQLSQTQQLQSSSFAPRFGLSSHPRPIGGVYRPIPLVPLTPFSTTNRCGDGFKDFSSTNAFSAPSSGGLNNFSGPRSFQHREEPSDNVPSFARAPPFASNPFQTARSGGASLFASAQGHDNRNMRSNNLFQSDINEGTSTSSFQHFSQPFGSRQTMNDKENQPTDRNTQAPMLFQKAGTHENHQSLRKVDQFSKLGNNCKFQNKINDARGSSQDDTNQSSTDFHLSENAKPEIKGDLTQSTPQRPVFGKPLKVAPSFKPVFKKPTVKNSSSSINSLSKMNERKQCLENTVEEAGKKRQTIFASSAGEGRSQNERTLLSTSQVFKPTHSKKTIASSASVFAQHKLQSSSLSRIAGNNHLEGSCQKKGNEANVAVPNDTFELSKPRTVKPATENASEEITPSINTLKQNNTLVQNKLSHGNAPLKMKKTDSVPRPKIMIKSEKELCDPDTDDFLTERLTTLKKSTSRVEKASKRNYSGRTSNRVRGSHLEYFKQKMSFLYKKSSEKCLKLVRGTHLTADLQSLKKKKNTASKFVDEVLSADNSKNPTLVRKGTQAPQPRSEPSGSMDPSQQDDDEDLSTVNFEGTSDSNTYSISSSVLATAGSCGEKTAHRGSFSPQAASSPMPHSQGFAPQPPFASPASTPHTPHQSFTSLRASSSPPSLRDLSLPFSSPDCELEGSGSNGQVLEEENDAVSDENTHDERSADQSNKKGSNAGNASNSTIQVVKNISEESSVSTTHTHTEGNRAALNEKPKTEVKKAMGCDSSRKSFKPPTGFKSSKAEKAQWLSSRKTKEIKSGSSSLSNQTQSQPGHISATKLRAKKPVRDKASGLQGAEVRRPQDLKDHMLELQQRTPTLVYVKCDDCGKWRELEGAESDPLDPADLPPSWTCSMNPDMNHSSCAVPEEDLPSADPDHYVVGNFTLGSVVWVRHGNTSYPAMVDDDPDTDTYFWLPIDSTQPNWYHVTYFETPVSRNWVRAETVRAFTEDDAAEAACKPDGSGKRRSEAAALAAATAKRLPIIERRQRFCFAARYKGPWFPPSGGIAAQPCKRPMKKNSVKKFKKLRNLILNKNE